MEGYYGQNFEDWFLWQVFKDQDGGFYVDVGAFDGIHLSNTYLFELAGWSGVCIEAHPDYYALLKENRTHSTCIHAACVADASEGRVTLYAEKLGLFSGVTPDRGAVERAYKWRGMTFLGFEPIDVPAVTLDGVLVDEEQKIDFVSIDTEGNELDVLRGFDLKRYKPRIIVVEANTPRTHRALNAYLTQRAYIYALKTGPNHFYCANIADIQCLQKAPKLQPQKLATQHPTIRGAR